MEGKEKGYLGWEYLCKCKTKERNQVAALVVQALALRTACI